MNKKKETLKLLGEETYKTAIHETVAKVGGKLTEKEKKSLIEVLEKIYLEGELPYKAMSFEDRDVEFFYNLGYSKYMSGKYDDAYGMFQLLKLIDPGKIRNFFGIAACCHQKGNYPKAIGNYLMVADMDSDTPIPFFHIVDCFERMENKKGMILALNEAIRRCGSNPKHKDLKTRCEIQVQSLLHDPQIQEAAQKKGGEGS